MNITEMKHCLQQIKTDNTVADIKYRRWNIQLTGNHLQCLCQKHSFTNIYSQFMDKRYLHETSKKFDWTNWPMNIHWVQIYIILKEIRMFMFKFLTEYTSSKVCWYFCHTRKRPYRPTTRIAKPTTQQQTDIRNKLLTGQNVLINSQMEESLS